jgi:hypothetical protein
MISATTMNFGEAQHANVVFDNGPKMISLSVDNSGGRATTLCRADIRLLFTDPLEGGVKDVTSSVFGGGEADIVRGTIENMDAAMKWLRRTTWGMRE